MAEVKLQLVGAFPHQADFLACTKRFAVVCAGFKAGKTVTGAFYAVDQLTKRPNVRGCWLAPGYAQAIDIGMDLVRGLLPAEYVAAKVSGTPTLSLSNGSSLAFRSAEEADRLYGYQHDFLVVDEGWKISGTAMNAALSTLAPTGGPVRVLSNAGPRTSWLFELWTRGADPNDPDVASFRWPTSLNPTISPDVIEEARRRLPAYQFKSEWLGEFFDVGSPIFGDVRACATGEFQEPREGAVCVGGLDVARTTDWNVLTIIDVASRAVIAWSRWQGTSWELTIARAAELSKKYNRARLFVDKTGVGDPILERLEAAGVPVEGVFFTNQSKRELIDELAARLEKREVAFPFIEVLVGELEAFTSSSGATGVVRYHSPAGGHDDAVISLALAVWGLRGADRQTMVWIPKPGGYFGNPALRGI